MLTLTENEPGLRSVSIAAAVLNCFSTYPELGATQVARELGVAKSTACRMLSALAAGGLLDRAEGGRYRLSLRMFELGVLAAERMPVRDAARPVLIELQQQVREMVQLGVPVAGRRRLHRPLRPRRARPPAQRRDAAPGTGLLVELGPRAGRVRRRHPGGHPGRAPPQAHAVHDHRPGAPAPGAARRPGGPATSAPGRSSPAASRSPRRSWPGPGRWRPSRSSGRRPVSSACAGTSSWRAYAGPPSGSAP